VPLVRVLHPEFGYAGTPGFCRRFIAFVVCGLVAVWSGVALFKAGPDPKDAVALASAEALGSAINEPKTADTETADAAFVQRPGKAGENKSCEHKAAEKLISHCTLGKAHKPRSVQSVNERPAIAAVQIGHRDDGPAFLPSEPAIPVAAAKPADAAPATDPAAASAVVESPTRAASVKKARTRSSYVERQRRPPSPRYSYRYYYQSGYARMW